MSSFTSLTTEHTPFTVVLTGGIASGKSAVSSLFEKLQVPVIDTDVIAREVVAPGMPALESITHEFGHEYILADGHLDRRRLRNAIFEDPCLKEKLEAILHPVIRDEVERRIKTTKSTYCVLVIPLFAEAHQYRWANHVLVVDAPEEIQIQRLMDRDQVTRSHAASILDAQSTRNERLALADSVIVNTGTLIDLQLKVQKMHEKFLAIAQNRNNVEPIK